MDDPLLEALMKEPDEETKRRMQKFSKFFYLFPSTAMLIGFLLVMVGQILALGFINAWRQNGLTWLIIFSILIGLAVIIKIFSILLPPIFRKLRAIWTRIVPQNIRENTYNILFYSVMGIMVTGMILVMVLSGYNEAKGRFTEFPDLVEPNIFQVDSAVTKQSESLQELSTRTTELLNQLGATESLIQDNKKQLTTTLVEIENQINSVEEASKNMASLTERQKRIQLNILELERILDGQAPITKKDLDSASKWGWIQGIGTSLIAAMLIVFGRIMLARLRKNKPAPSQEEEI